MNPLIIVLLTCIVTINASNSINDDANFRRTLGYNATIDLAECDSCIANSAWKICSEDEANSISYCCDSSDTSSVCGGSFSDFECTTDSGISGDARYIL